MFLLSALLSAAFASGGGILDAVVFNQWGQTHYVPRSYRSEEDSDSYRRRKRRHHSVWTPVTTVLCFGILLFANFMNFWSGTPAFSGNGWVLVGIMNLGITFAVFGIADLCRQRLTAVVCVTAALLVLATLSQTFFYNNWNPGNHRTTMGNELKLNFVQDQRTYPPTLNSAMVTVSDASALSKATKVMNEDIPKTNIPLSSVYTIDLCSLKPVAAHMYYICALRPVGTVNIRDVKGIVPAFIVVDAQNADHEAWVKWGYRMNYYRGGTNGHSIDRLIWNSGWGRHFNIDDLTLEVDDQWNPMYTAALVRSVFRMQQGVPVGLITVNPVTGEIKEYPINRQPSWVTRTYSDDLVTKMANWAGEWQLTPWNVQGSINRYKVDGEINLVYTKYGLAWQVLYKGKNAKDSSISFICFASTVLPHMDCYKAPDGLSDQAAATHAIVTSGNNLKSLVPASLALHELDGMLWYVAPLEAPNDNNPADPKNPDSSPPAATGTADPDKLTAEPYSGIALVPATDTNPSDVIIANTLSDAMVQVGNVIANGNATFMPGATAKVRTITGVVSAATKDPVAKGTNEVIQLAGDPNEVFVGAITGTSFQNYQMSLATPGDTVSMQYYDTSTTVGGKSILNISAYTLVTTGKTAPAPTKQTEIRPVGPSGLPSSSTTTTPASPTPSSSASTKAWHSGRVRSSEALAA